MRITLKQLQIFAAIARTGQVAKAAEHISLSSPATSMALTELERQLNCRLFERVGNRLQLNANGHRLLPMANQLLGQVQDIESAFATSSMVLAGTLSISASNTIGNFLLTKAVVAFTQQHQQCRVELNIDNSRRVSREVAEFRCELGFIEGYSLDNRIVATPWHHDRLRIVCHPAHPLSGATVTAAAVQGASWVLREEGSGTREYFVNAANKLDLHPEVAFSLPTPDAIKQAVKQGAGLGVLSELAVERELARRELGALEIEGLELARPFYLLRHKQRSFSPLAEAFIDFCSNFLQLRHEAVAK